MTLASQVVLTADGSVLAVSGGAPEGWVGTRIAERQDLPSEVREGAQALLRALHRSARPLCTVTVPDPTGGSLQLLAVDAIPLRRTATDFAALLRAAIEPLRQQATSIDAALTLTIDDGFPATVLIDPEKVAWMVTTLAGNALRYVRRGSRILPGGLVAVRAWYDPAARTTTISVEDDGPGIPAATLSSLMSRAPGRPISAGVGLMLVFEVVAAHGGRLDVQSRTSGSRQGTTIKLTFPVL